MASREAQPTSTHIVILLPFHKYSIHWLAESDFKVILSDKDGTFALLSKAEFATLASQKMPPNIYMPIMQHDVSPNVLSKLLCQHAKSLAEVFDDPYLLRDRKDFEGIVMGKHLLQH